MVAQRQISTRLSEGTRARLQKFVGEGRAYATEADFLRVAILDFLNKLESGERPPAPAEEEAFITREEAIEVIREELPKALREELPKYFTR